MENVFVEKERHGVGLEVDQVAPAVELHIVLELGAQSQPNFGLPVELERCDSAPSLPVNGTATLGEIQGGDCAPGAVKYRVDDVHLEGVHDGNHVILLLEI